MRAAPLTKTTLIPVLFIVLVPYAVSPIVKATMTESFKVNQSLGNTLVDQARIGIQSGAMPLEGMGQNASLSEESVSHENVAKALKDSEMGQYVLEQEKRPDKKHVVIDPVHDPLMKASTEVVQDPLRVLKAEATVIREEGGETLEEHICEEAADPIELSCVQNLNVNVKNPGYESHIVTATVSGVFVWGHGGKDPNWNVPVCCLKLWNGAGLYDQSGKYKIAEVYPNMGASVSVSPDLSSTLQGIEPGSIQARCISTSKFSVRDVAPRIVSRNHKMMTEPQNTSSQGMFYINGNYGLLYQRTVVSDALRFEVMFKRKPEIAEAWQSGCAALDALSDDEGKSPCDLLAERCTQGPETRIINGLPVYRDCWQKTRTYLCGSALPGTCGEYRIRGCSQTKSECVQKVGEQCIRWKQTYQCKKTGQARTRTSIKGEGVPWCLDGDCYSPSWDANSDMLTAMSRMAVLNQIQKDMKDLSVFTGKGLQCRRSCAGFQNCCGTERGWGLDIRFAACDDEEKLLAQKQKNGLCVFLGTYCSKRAFGVCIQKKSTSCCYESRIARIVQVAAHQQLGLPWGSAENPQCRGLTPEELSKVDLEKVDFRELYEEIMARYKAPQIITPQKETLTTTVKGVSKGEPVVGKEGL